jgi:hypothetical protein
MRAGAPTMPQRGLALMKGAAATARWYWWLNPPVHGCELTFHSHLTLLNFLAEPGLFLDTGPFENRGTKAC